MIFVKHCLLTYAYFSAQNIDTIVGPWEAGVSELI